MAQAAQPGIELLRAVRAAFVQQGTTLGAWCRKNKVIPSNCRQALIGSWDGPRGRAVRKRVIQASGLKAAA